MRAPRSVSEAEIDRLVQEKEHGSQPIKQKCGNASSCRPWTEFGPAGRLYFSAGVIRPSLRKQGIFPSMERAFCCPICRRQSCAPPLLTFYRKAAKALLPSAVERFAPLVGKAPQQVRITSAKTRWGSCSAKGGLNFSWRLLCAPPEAMDYVVVHELAHLIEFNHSSRFWAIVEGILPDYKARRQSLKEVQESLLRQGW